MKRCAALFLLLAGACTGAEVLPWEKAVEELDRTIENHAEILMLMDGRIETLRRSRAASPSEEYGLVDAVFNEYYMFDKDSAFFYAHVKDSIALSSGNPALVNDSRFDLAGRYLASGMYQEALDCLNAVDTLAARRDGMMSVYYQTLHSIYHGLALTTGDEFLRRGHRQAERRWQALSQKEMKEDMLDYYTVNAGILLERGDAARARSLLESAIARPGRSIHELSILNYWLAKARSAEGDSDGELQAYAVSARYDFLVPVRASRSLCNVARLLLDKGETAGAFKYIQYAYRGAVDADAILCKEEIADVMPAINAAMDKFERRRFSMLRASVGLLISILAISLLAMLIMRHFNKRLRKAGEEVAERNREIRTINASLREYVAKLKNANDIKDTFIGRYLSMFSDNISSLERYRSRLRQLVKSRSIDDIVQELRSDEFIDAERKTLYKEFDSTFLGAFPDFVTQLNALLKPGYQIGKNLPDGCLNNELRVFALIRLGVQDSAKIARFLKKAPSTIYNYRVKLRSAACCPYDEFETRLMEIGVE